MVVGVGALAYKLSKSDTQKIEEQYGRSVEEMTDEELQQAVDELNLRKQPLDEDDQIYLDSNDDEQEALEPDYLDELERLGDLKERGLITDEEFEAKKKEILGL